jgi:transcriptional antiterminator NusG
MIEANLVGEYHIIKINNKLSVLGEIKGGEPVPLRLSEVEC